MAEEDVTEADLSGRLATVLEEIRDVMEKRKQRIEELRQEITNFQLSKKAQLLLLVDTYLPMNMKLNLKRELMLLHMRT